MCTRGDGGENFLTTHSVGDDGAQAIARVESINGLQRPLDALELVRDIVIQLEPALHATKTHA